MHGVREMSGNTPFFCTEYSAPSKGQDVAIDTITKVRNNFKPSSQTDRICILIPENKPFVKEASQS